MSAFLDGPRDERKVLIVRPEPYVELTHAVRIQVNSVVLGGLESGRYEVKHLPQLRQLQAVLHEIVSALGAVA